LLGNSVKNGGFIIGRGFPVDDHGIGSDFVSKDTKPAQKPSGREKEKEKIMFHNRLLFIRFIEIKNCNQEFKKFYSDFISCKSRIHI
jgi:hypothetical protein